MKVNSVWALDALDPVAGGVYLLFSCQGMAVTLFTRYLPSPQGTELLFSVRQIAWDRSTGRTSFAPVPVPWILATRPAEPPQRGTMNAVVVGAGVRACRVMSQLSLPLIVSLPASDCTSWFVPVCKARQTKYA